MDFFDDVVSKAKEAIDVASKKTGDAVAVQKQKFDIAAIESKLAKDFQSLGEFYYKKIKSGKMTDEDAAGIIDSINDKIGKINILKNEINSIKHKRICPECGAAVDDTSNYCNSCGAKLTYENAESTEE